MKTKLCAFLVFSLFCIIIPQKSFSQITFNFGPTIGATLPIGKYGGGVDDFYNLDKYGSKIGGNFGAVGKLKFPFLVNVQGFINYNISSRSGDIYPGTVEIDRNIFMLGLGPEVGFPIPATNLRPYAGVDFIMSIFSGKVSFNNVAEDLNGEHNFSKDTRLGMGFKAGVELKLTNFTLDLNAKYSILNLFKKEFVSDTSRISNYINLNDDADPAYTPGSVLHPVGDKRIISAFQFNVSIIYKVSI